jgi:hypothetical protein
MPGSFSIPLTVLPVGSRTFGPATVPNPDSSVTMSIDRTAAGGLGSLTAASTLEMAAEMSTDGGTTWHAVDTNLPGTHTMWGTEGGPAESAASAGTWPLFPATGRRVRATVTVAGSSSIAVAGSIATA